MLINIPEQKNCWHCGFLDYEQGFCVLKNIIECGDMYGPYHTEGYGEDPHLEENRPDWCPFKEQKITKIIESVLCTNYTSKEQMDLCDGCKFYEDIRQIFIKLIRGQIND